MSQTLALPDPLYAALREAAEETGTTPTGWIAARLPKTRDQETKRPNPKPETMADRFANRVGRIRSGGQEALSEDCGRKLGEILEQKRDEGRL